MENSKHWSETKWFAMTIWIISNFLVFLLLAGLVYINVLAFGGWGMITGALLLTLGSVLRDLDPRNRLEEQDG
jgi:hypothetical protein